MRDEPGETEAQASKQEDRDHALGMMRFPSH